MENDHMKSIAEAMDRALDGLLSAERGTLFELVSLRYDKIIEARSRGYTLQVIAKSLTDAGVPISADTLRKYLKRIAGTGRKAKSINDSTLNESNRIHSTITVKPDEKTGMQMDASIKPDANRSTSNSLQKTLTPIPAKLESITSVSSSVPTTVSSGPVKKSDEDFPQTPTDWPIVKKRINGEEVELYQSPKYKLYSVLPGIDPDAPYGRNEAGVSYNRYGALTRAMIGKGFIGEDL